MKIYRCIVSGDEMFTDSVKINVIDECLYEVYCKHVVRKEGDVVLDGANPSAEEADEGSDDAVQAGLDVVLNQRLVDAPMDKSGFKSYLKTFTKALQEKWKEEGMSDEKIAEAKGKIMEGVKKILPKLEDASFYMGESMNPDGLVGVLEYRDGAADDGGEAPILLFLKHGLIEEKV